MVNLASEETADARIELAPYNPSWPAMFEAERKVLHVTLARWLAGPAEHIGSTAVPHLIAKPIIDIMAPVRTLADSLAAIMAAAEAGYVYYPYNADSMHWFCKPSPSHRTHQLHLVPLGSSLWRERLVFRDVLRRSSLLASDYAALKRDLAARFPLDREAYTEAKTPFVLAVLSVAKEGLKGPGSS
jgi:GrpB-like predicted nucleotidyltransferase (UPF0157 family)